MTIRTRTVLLFASLLVGTSSCAGRPQRSAEVLRPGFESQPPRTLHLFPVVDRRLDRSEELASEEVIRGKVKEALEDRGYEVVFAEPPVGVDLRSPGELDEAARRALVPPGAEVVLLVAIDDFTAGWTAAFVARYEFMLDVSGRAYHSRDGMVWFDQYAYTHKGGGILGGLTAAAMSQAGGFEGAFERLFETLPDPPED